ncbi:LTA synthase family protein [Planomicrobium sp. Y74]|uniref:LTA synthase family protein n=1 Tax=Planomicrobium sp. Y74 TaxID=2478977 RepID=UPI000EF51444|nr:LTA synthase family protein [Planomicrobium sp. Y74]RLQ90212.1 LTA synthase family protein [Planomicrobium sp. Y74]
MNLQNERLKNLTGIQLTLLITGILWLKTVIVCLIGFNLSIQSLFDIVLILTSSIGALLLVMGFSFYFGGKVKPAVLFGLSVVGTAILYGDLLYYRFYNDFVTAPILFQFDNVGGLSASTVELMSLWDVLLFIDLFLIGWFLFKQKFELTIQKQTKKKYIAFGAALLVLTIGLGLVKSVHLFSESYDREQVVKSLGPLNYHVYDLAVGISAPLQRLTTTEAEAVASIESLQHKDPGRTDLYGLAEGKNIVLISLESTQDFVIGQKVNGEEVTPFLNDLIEESFYFDQVYDQTAQGKTSDAEFMMDTSLYPLASGSVFVRRPENTFHSLPHILKEEKDYYAATFHGNVDTFWNRNVMYETLGYDRYFSKEDYNVTEENSVNYGLKDIPFFTQSADYMKNLPEPYYAKFLTLTNHFPFLLDEEDLFIDEATTEEDVVNRYVTTVRYLDKSLETFFEKLKEEGMYEDTVFVLVGDHYGISEKYEAGLNELLGEEATITNQMQHKQVPLIIHIPGQQGETISTPGGQVDIRPTLLHLMGIKTENRYSFGHNLFTRDSDHPVIFRDGSFISDDYIYKDNVCYGKETGQVIDIRQCEPYMETVREELKLSDKIIFGDLLRYMVGEE